MKEHFDIIDIEIINEEEEIVEEISPDESIQLEKFIKKINFCANFAIRFVCFIVIFLAIGIAWELYEIIIFGTTNPNTLDTLLGLFISIILSFPISNIFINKRIKK